MACGFALATAPLRAEILRAGASATVELMPPEAASIDLALDAADGTAYLVRVEQDGVDVALRAGDQPAVDAPLDRRGAELLLLEQAAGTMRLTLELRETVAPAGRVRVELLALAPGDPLRSAYAAFTRAGTAYAAGKPDDRRAALSAYTEAGALAAAAGAPALAAQADYCAAVLLRLTDQAKEALPAAERVLAAWQALPGSDAVLFAAATRNEIGLLRWQLGDARAARLDFAAAAQAAAGNGDASRGDAFTTAAARSNLCLMDLVVGDVRAGLACYDQVLPALEGLPALAQNAWLNVGRAADLLGEPDRAFAAYERGLALAGRLGDAGAEGRLHNNLGVLARQLGDFERALDHYGRALAIFETRQDKRWRARVLGNLGALYGELGEVERARGDGERALAAWRELGDPAGEAAANAQLGRQAELAGELPRAIEHFQRALDLDRQGGRRLAEALALSNLGGALTQAGRAPDALPLLERAVSLLAAEGDAGRLPSALCRQGAAQLALGQADLASATLERALSLSEAAAWRGDVLCAQLGLARLERQRGRLEPALRHTQEALRTAGGMRRDLIAPDLRAAFGSLQRQAHELEVALRMASHRREPGAGHDLRALEASERARARTLVELLAEAGADLPKGLGSGQRGALQAATRRLAAKVERERAAKDAERAALREEVAALEREVDRLERELRLADPRWAALRQSPALSADALRAELGADAVALAYFLADDQSYLWRIAGDGVQVFELPPRAEIEEAARTYAEQLASPRATPWDATAGVRLAAMVLGPVAATLEGKTPPTLVVVPDGALHYVPFATLSWPSSAASPTRVVDRLATVQLPSIEALALLRAQAARRQPAPHRIALFADPVFAADDPRLGAAPGVPASPGLLPRLPGSRQEASAIAALARQLSPGDEPLLALDFEARRDAVLGDRLAPYRTLHFATHGLIDATRPALSSLLLSTFDARGNAIDGRLALHDLYGLELQADLAVLSGCRTALGRELRAEGLVGLVQGFFYAGTPRVVASLWPVEDRAAAELMRLFYSALWRDGLPVAHALSAAQRQLAADRRFRDPRLWGAFVALGDWRGQLR
jgi:CHAT domain-containing protein/tetratricopeptide (TPR) repeat protein